jgi:hypothetical protein
MNYMMLDKKYEEKQENVTGCIKDAIIPINK